MDAAELRQRFDALRSYVDWRDNDAARVRAIAESIEPYYAEIVDDFYDAIKKNVQTDRVITGGDAQIARLKASLQSWLRELFICEHDDAYLLRRWRVGQKHVEIGLDQIFTSAALSRLRGALQRCICDAQQSQPGELFAALESLNKLLDLDLAIIGDAYESEHLRREQEIERRRMEAVVHREREFSEGLIERAQAIVLVLDTDGRIVRFNAYMEQLSGYTLDEVHNRDWFDVFLTEADRQPLRELFQKMLSGTDATTAVNPIVTKDGRQRQISWSNKALRDADGTTTAVLAIGQDITEFKIAQQRALQAERLAAIGQMMTGLAHESRNALQRIQACAEMLELEVEDNDEAIDLLGRIQNAQEHLRRLFDEVRGYAAPIKLDRSHCRLTEVWHEAWEILTPQRADRRARLIECTGEIDLVVLIDRFRLVQVFRNLLENALAACEDPVEISISCDDAEIGGKPAVLVSVCDNGPGISADTREKIFEPFFTTKIKGTGLGMSIAQRIIESHGGTITVGAATASGTVIQIKLPR